MKTKNLWLIWGIYYIVCLGLAFIPQPQDFLYGLLMCIGLGFFIPGGMLLYRAVKTHEKKTLRQIRAISLFSMVAAVVLFILTVLASVAPQILGDFLQFLMILCCAPMICGQVWVLILFGWACFWLICLQQLKKDN